jgi:hypothetical protein
MTALPITLGAKEYRTYLAARTRFTNLINDDLIETLRMNASLFVEPKSRMLTTVGTEIPCGGPFQPRYKNLNGRWIKTSPTLQLTTKQSPSPDSRFILVLVPWSLVTS